MIDPDFRRKLDSLDRAGRRHDKRFRDNSTLFSDLDYEPEAPPKSTRIENPRLILGIQHPTRPRPTCEGCGGERLPKYAYCARCHRSGVDHLLPNVVTQQAVAVDDQEPARFRPKGAGA